MRFISVIKRESPSFALWSILALFLLGTVVNAADEKVCAAEPTNGSCQRQRSQVNALIEWINSKEHGSVSSDSFRIETVEYDPPLYLDEPMKMDRNRKLSNGFKLNPEFQFYATKNIPKGTVLMEIPEEAIIGGILKLSNKSINVSKYLLKKDDDDDKDHVPTCRMIEEIVNEQEKGENSTFYPYLQHVFGDGNPLGKQPINWSEKGQFVFWGMMGAESANFHPNTGRDKHDVDKMCETYMKFSRTKKTIPIPKSNEANHSLVLKLKEDRSKLEEKAYSYFAKHAWGTSLIPLFDMIPHRNGRYKNVEAKFVEVDSGESIDVEPRNERLEFFRSPKSDQTKQKKLVVFANRDIKEGEPLHVSYNQCEYLGCGILNNTYSTGHIMADLGIVEKYPRRWILDIDVYESRAEFHVVFDVDEDMETGKKTFEIVNVTKGMLAPDEVYGLNLISAGLDRWNALKWEVDVHTEVMESYERDSIVGFHKAIQESYALHWMHRNDPFVETENENQKPLKGGNSRNFDDLEKPAGRATHFRGEYMACAEGEVVDNGESLPDTPVKGFYQELDYRYEDDIDNTYMNMATMLHSASNFRAHYHESSIHVPLQYVKDVKRVAYIGGGDNMVLHEVLKYPNLELVVGMELDQQASRSSLKYFGTTPAYFDPRVQWWYGNAANTLSTIPEEYFGTFDLILVDLLNDVSEGVKGAAGLSLLELAPLLMKQDGGVIARNEDWSERADSSINMAKRVIVYDYYDCPRLCEICITIGSNSIDFSKGERYDHGVNPILRLKPFNQTSHDGWSGYHDHSRSHDASNSGNEWTTADPMICGKIERALASKEKQGYTGGGVFEVIEVENVSIDLKSGCTTEFQNLIIGIATKNGLTEVEKLFQPDIDKNAFFLILVEGYINVRIFPSSSYVSFDLMLWGSSTILAKSETIENDLVSAVGGGQTKNSTSSFRVTAGGMAMDDNEVPSNGIIEKAMEYYCAGRSDFGSAGDDELSPGMEKSGVFDHSVIIPEILGVSNKASRKIERKPFYAVFCGVEIGTECKSFSAVKENTNMTVRPIYSCEAFDHLEDCTEATEKQLSNAVVDEKRLDGMIIDTSVVLDMGKVIHKVFNNTVNQVSFLERSFSVLSPLPSGEHWRRVLIERFRTEIIVVPPVTTAIIETYTEEKSEEWMVVSVRDYEFFASMGKSLLTIEERTGLMTMMKRAMPGTKPLFYDWNPPVSPTDSDYFNPVAAEQWSSQKPLAYQHLIQMELGRVQTPVAVNETVLIVKTEYASHWFNEEYVRGKVLEVRDNQYVVEMMTHITSKGKEIKFEPYRTPIRRDLIRKISPTEKDRKYGLGDIVLVQRVDLHTGEESPFEYFAAYITSLSETGVASIRTHNDGGDEYFQANIPPERIMIFDESPEFSQTVEDLSKDQLEKAFEAAAVDIGFVEDEAYIQDYTIGMGAVITIISGEGSMVLKWDGLNGVEINLFAHDNYDVDAFKKIFLKEFQTLSVVAQDSFPRGYGTVVNFEHEIKGYEPHWIKVDSEDMDDDGIDITTLEVG